MTKADAKTCAVLRFQNWIREKFMFVMFGTFALLEDYNFILIVLFYVPQDQVGERAIFCPKMLSE
jgi:hypothetical protein